MLRSKYWVGIVFRFQELLVVQETAIIAFLYRNRYEDEARVQLRNKNKTKAKQLLRQKLLVLKKIKEKDGQYDKLLHIMHRLAQTREQKDVISIHSFSYQLLQNVA